MEEIPARLSGKPSWLISQLAVHVGRMAFRGFAETGARGYHYRILASLQEFGPASQAQLGRWGRMDRSDVVAAVTQLAEQGFVERQPDPEHGRRNRVLLTEAGAAQLERMDVVLDRMQEELLAPLPAPQRQEFVRMLGVLLAEHDPS
ncbi:MarR family winged helix-turn-helix transcriptional regulator [Kineosporia rhizophila]|uniref:MarR family winged helix-turn-helix transcriptional regulator n=1 Tax=Kineosporia TaxID=49184 RepID=UPI000AE20F86|nr:MULTISPECIES: MarR family winged helix-turn-helix transcriptional regulator [Kineosporia]MCE0536269.1 MarR family winged helix-turn-helix transcriptional regulator [Kineosporia rhizophila]GLY15144.1 hypothetical protein Kisp01_21590 [Kineosporia sp. NBRC 101677]